MAKKRKVKEFTNETVAELLEKYYAPMVIEHIKYMVIEDKRMACKFKVLLKENEGLFNAKSKNRHS